MLLNFRIRQIPNLAALEFVQIIIEEVDEILRSLQPRSRDEIDGLEIVEALAKPLLAKG